MEKEEATDLCEGTDFTNVTQLSLFINGTWYNDETALAS
jgi:hypothetical protein